MKKALLGKKAFLAMLLGLILVCQASLVAVASDVPKGPVLKVDREDASQLPRNFRIANDSFKSTLKDGTLPSRVGMEDVRASASSIFSEKEFEQVLAKIPVASKQVIVVDLRQESHGYLNGTAVSWFLPNNWGNDGKRLDEVKKIESAQLEKALANSPITVYNFDDDKNVLTTSFQMDVTKALTEEEMVKSHGAGYYRLALSDHFRPEDEYVDQFVEWYKKLPKDAWLHIHCFAGMGRTTVFMNMVDILQNAKKVSFDDIVGRQGLIGNVDLRTIDGKMNWKRKAYIERLQFTKHFYEYVKQSPKDFPVKYSEWAKKHDY
ncbi:protein tyrosine phosphatase [Pelosinus sp. IPA-1]|uniref:protein tyrosine phosphatase n=1 Tax=Pelosinus sp. IPA-1 TaxID=3029569 RepID=UPI00243614F4|nr:protein tyrosine phosphatase [Pelosinus sp. IPA-1]GMA98444.1 protein-tyrosine-phosphatase [Pelosinus sp. IPA-1]